MWASLGTFYTILLNVRKSVLELWVLKWFKARNIIDTTMAVITTE